MGLSSWIQNLLARPRAHKVRSAREDFVQLFLTRLEDRRVLNADFSLVGGNLELKDFTQGTDENLTIQDTGMAYQFTLSEGNWFDDATATDTGSNVLTVNKTDVNMLHIDGSAIGVDIQFGVGMDTVDFSPLTNGLEIVGAGAVFQDVGSTLIAPQIDVDANSTTLEGATNDFGTIELSGNSASINDANSLILEDVVLASSLTINVASGQSTQALGTAISGGTSLTKDGAGTLILSEINTYAGATDITAGELQVTGEIGNGSPAGTVTVRTGATLSGSGTINADVTGETGSNITATGDGFTLGNAASATGFATLGTLTVDAFTVNLNDLDTAELGSLTTINGGTLTAANGLTVGSGDTLSGGGTVNTGAAALTIQSGGTLTPGNSPGLIQTNHLVLESGSTYVVDLDDPYTTPGTDYDQTSVTGSVTLNGATLMLQGGTVAPAAGTSLLLIQNDGSDAVTGTFNGLAQGDTVTVGSFTGQINYFGGDGNDVTLEVAGGMSFTNTGGGDVTIRRNAAISSIEIVKGGVVVQSFVETAVTEIVINGDPSLSDTLIVDYGSGGFFTQTVTFDGGEDAGNTDNDMLVVTGGTFGRAEHTFTGPEAGTILYDVDGTTATTADQGTIVYTGLEPVDMTGSTITDLVFNLPGTGDGAILEDDGILANGISQIRSQNGTFETTTFANPTGSLTVNLGGDDAAFTLDALPDFTASLAIDGGAGNDTVTFQGDLALGSVTQAGDLDVTAETILFTGDADVDTTLGTVGDVTLTAARNIQMDAGTSILAGGDVVLSANQGVPTSGTFTGILLTGATITVNGASSIDLLGLGGDTGDGNIGVSITDSQITSEDGNITVTGTGAGSGDNNHGLLLAGTTNITTSTGNMVLTTAAGTGANSRAFLAQGSATLGDGATTGTVLIEGNGGVIEFQNASGIQTTNNTALAITLRDASNVITGNITAASGTLIIGVGQDVTGSITQASGTALNINSLTISSDISTETPITLDSATNQIATVGQIERGGTLTIVDSAGGLTFNGPINAVAGVDDSVTISTSGGDLVIAGAIAVLGGNIVLTSTDADVQIDNAVTAAAPGNITINGQNVTVSGTGLVSLTGGSTITATTPRNGLITGTGILSINAANVTTLEAGALVQSLGGVVQFTTNDIVIQAGASIDAGAPAANGVLIIRNATLGRPIQLGGADGGGTLHIDNDELSRIQAGSLRIGRLDAVANAGDITLAGDFLADPTKISLLQLFTGGNITQTAGSLSADNLSVFGGVIGQNGAAVDGNVNMTSPTNNVGTLAILTGGDVEFVDANALTVGAISDAVDNAPTVGEGGNSGITSTTSYVDLTALTGNLVVAAGIQVSANDVNPGNNLAINFLAAGSEALISIEAGAVVTSALLPDAIGSHRYTADNMEILGTIVTPVRALPTDPILYGVQLRNANANVSIDLGSAIDGTPNVLELSQAELTQITTNLLAIGRNTAGTETTNIVISQLINPYDADTDTLHLITAGTVTDAPGAGITDANNAVLASLLIEAGDGATLDNLSTNDVDVLAAVVANAGASFTFRDADDLTIGTVNGVTVTGVEESVSISPFSGITTNGGDVTITTEAGDLLVNENITATDGGDITLDANGGNSDVAINANLMTGGAGGNVMITADDAVTLNGDIMTSGPGIVSIIANVSAADGDGDGRLTMNPGSSITTVNGNITLQTTADADDEASITVEQITTTNGIVLVDANGQNADVTLQNTVATGNTVTVLADDSVTFAATGVIMAGGNVLVQANQNDTAANGDLSMADGSVIDAGTGTITLLTTGANGGDITLGQIITQNATDTAITITSHGAVVDGGDTGGADTIANAAGSRVNITANTGIGAGNALETSAVRFDVQNNGAADLNIDNTTAGLNVVIEGMTTLGGNISFTNASGTGLLTIAGGVTSGDAGTDINGGNISINTSGDLLVAALLSTRDGRGGAFMLTGGAAFEMGAAIQLGTGNITITTGSEDILFNTDLTIDNGPATFLAPDDIIVSNDLMSRVDDGTGTDNFVNATVTAVLNGLPIDSHITLRADHDGNGAGGVLVQTAGRVVASGNLTISGSDLSADMLLVTALDPSIQNGVHIESDGINLPLLAAGNLTLQNQPGIAAADIVIEGTFGTQNATTPTGPGLDILIDANNNIYLTDDTTIFTPTNIVFGDASTPRQDAVIDDLNAATPSNLTIQNGGIATIYGRVGDNTNAPNLSERIDSLNILGETILQGGFVSTKGDQTFQDNVSLHASTDLAGSTTFTAGGNLNFNGAVRGFDFDISSPNTPIQDDIVLNITGTTTFLGQVGINPAAPGEDPNQRIGDGIGHSITINSVGQTFFEELVFTQSGFLQTETAGRITFRQDVNVGLGDTGNLFLHDVTLDGLTFLTFLSEVDVTIGSATPNEDQLLIMATSGINTSGLGRNITINSQVIDPLVTNEDLQLTLGQGDLLITGNVGLNTNRFGQLVVVSANDFRFTGQTIFSETLTQMDGLNNGADQADTELHGTINTSLADGVTLATTNVVYDAAIVTNGGRVLTQASGNIAHTAPSSITTMGGMVVSDAGAAIIMQESPAPTINTAGGQVVLRAGGNLTVSQIVSPGGFVSLTSTGGAILDAGDTFNPNILSAQLRLDAATGIAAAGALETTVSNLEARNTVAGAILISNTGDLTIGGLPGVTVETFRNGLPLSIALPPIGGIINAGGTVGLQNTGNLLELPNTTIQAANGNIELAVLGGNATFQGQVVTSTNNTIVVTVPGTFTLQNVANTTGGIISSGGSVNLQSGGNWMALPNTLIQAANGQISIATNANALFQGQVTTLSDSPIFVDVAGTFTLQNVAGTSGGQMISGGDIGLRSNGDWIALPMTTIQGNNGTVAIGVVGDAVFQGHVAALNGNHLFVDVTGDFTLANGFQDADFLVNGNGQIVVTADGSVNFDPNSGAKVVSQDGVVRQATPFVPLQLISTPQISTDGTANLTFSIGLPGEKNFTFIVDWGDGTTDVRTVNAGTHTITHIYVNPPDPANPGANVRVFLMVATDPHIHFFGNNHSLNPAASPLVPPPNPALPRPSGPLPIGQFLFPNQTGVLTLNQFVLSAISPVNFNTTDLSISSAFQFVQEALNSISNPNLAFPMFPDNIDNLGIVTAVPVFAVPVSGFGAASVIEPDILPPFFVPGSSMQPLPDEVTDFNQDADDADFSGGDTEEEGEDEVQVRLRVLSPAGQVLFEYDIEVKYLSNPAPLWARLSDGRYQIVIVEPGSAVPLVVRDVQLKDNKVIRRFDRVRRASDEGTSRLETPANVIPASWNAPEAAAGESPAANPDGVWENWQPPHSARRLPRVTPELQEEDAEEPLSPATAAAFTGGLALTAMRMHSSKDAESSMMRQASRALSPAARLRRRLRK